MTNSTNSIRIFLGAMLAIASCLLVGQLDLEKRSEAADLEGTPQLMELVVRFKNPPSPSSPEAQRFLSMQRLSTNQYGDFYKVTLPSGSSLTSQMAELEKDSNIRSVEPNYPVHKLDLPAGPPNDTYYSTEDNIEQGLRDLWGYQRLDLESAWSVSTGTASTVIAVIDSGVDYTHPDIDSNIWYNQTEVEVDLSDNQIVADLIANGNANSYLDCGDLLDPDNAIVNEIDDDGNGYIDDVCGWDFVNEDNDPRDDDGHGTHVAGIIAAEADNNAGILGVCPNCQVMALKFLDEEGNGDIATAIRALNYALQNGADIINNSWGGSGYSQSLQDIMDDAFAADVVSVAASGNTNSDVAELMPANLEHVITVAALGDNGEYKAGYSNYGDEVDFVAPGESILSLRAEDPDNAGTYLGLNADSLGGIYIAMDGTSMAAPHVSALIGLILSYRPTLQPFHIEYILEETAEDIYDEGVAIGVDVYTGYGLPDTAAALSQSVDTTPPVASLTSTPDMHSNETSIDVAVGPSADVTAYKFRIDDGAWSQSEVPQPLHITTSGLDEGNHTIYVIGKDAIGNWQSISNATSYSWNIDITAPARINTLDVTQTTTDSVSLTWTAVGDDGSTGTAAAYDIRYASSLLTDSNWDNSSQADNEPAPSPSGIAGESFILSNLSSAQRLYIAIRAVDEAGNSSTISNQVYVMTLYDGEIMLVSGSGAEIYLLENDTLHLIPSADIFEALGYDWDEVVEVADSWLDVFAMGDSIYITVQPNSLVQTISGGTIYLITEQGQRQPFACEAAVEDLGYDLADVIEFDSLSLGQYTLGSTLTSDLCTEAENDDNDDPEENEQDPEQDDEQDSQDEQDQAEDDDDSTDSNLIEYIIQAGDWLLKIGRDFNLTLEELLAVNDISDPNRIYPGQVIFIPSNQEEDQDEQEGDDDNTTLSSYIVQAGDWLLHIAEQFGTSLADILSYNQISNPNLIYPGQEIFIPGTEQTQEEEQDDEQVEDLTTYVVQAGDWLLQIARRLDTTLEAILENNNIIDPNLIYPGQEILVPAD